MAGGVVSEEGVPGRGQGTRITGEMATFRVVVEFPEEESDGLPSETLLTTLREQRKQIHKQIEGEVRQLFGPDAEVDELVILRGSVEILAVVSTVAMVVGNINALMDNLEKASERIRRIVRSIVARGPIMPRGSEYRVRGDWTRGPAMRRLEMDSGSQLPRTGERVELLPRSSRVDVYVAAIFGTYGLLIAILVLVAILIVRS